MSTAAMSPPPWRASAVALWAGVQAAIVIAAAAGWRAWPRQADPAGSYALAELVTAQVVTAALLFPRLLAAPATAVACVAITLPFSQLAGVLAAAPEPAVLLSSATVGLWVIGLAAVAGRLRSDAAARWAVCGATLLCLGGTLVYYGRCEAAAAAEQPWPGANAYGPLMAAVAQSAGAPARWEPWLWAAVPLVAAGTDCVVRAGLKRIARPDRGANGG